MKMSDNGLMALISFEGIVLTTYRDSEGVLTIGIGHTKAAGDPDPKKLIGVRLEADAVIAMFRKDIRQYEDAVNRVLTRKPEQHQFDAMVSFCYNAGPSALKRALWIRSFNAGNDTLAAQQIMNWQKPPSLHNRRLKEQGIFMRGSYPLPFSVIYDQVDRNLKPINGKSIALEPLFEKTGDGNMLGNYSKFWGAVVGSVMSYLVARYALPEEWKSPEVIGALVTILTSATVYWFPANKPS